MQDPSVGGTAPDTPARARWRGHLALAETAQDYYEVWREGGPGRPFAFRGAWSRGNEEGVRPLPDLWLVPHVMPGRKGPSAQIEYATRRQVNNSQRRHEVTLTARVRVNARVIKLCGRRPLIPHSARPKPDAVLRRRSAKSPVAYRSRAPGSPSAAARP